MVSKALFCSHTERETNGRWRFAEISRPKVPQFGIRKITKVSLLVWLVKMDATGTTSTFRNINGDGLAFMQVLLPTPPKGGAK